MIRFTEAHGEYLKCDKCGERLTAELPGLNMYQAVRGEDKNIIILHYGCLDKLIASAKRAAAKLTSASEVSGDPQPEKP